MSYVLGQRENGKNTKELFINNFSFLLPKHKFKSYFFTVPNDTSDFKMSFKGTNSKSNDLSNSLNGFYEVLINSIERYTNCQEISCAIMRA